MKRPNWLKRLLIILATVSLISLLGINLIKHNDYIASTDRGFFSFFSMIRYALIDNPINTISRISQDIAGSWNLRYENDALRQQLEAAAHWEMRVNELEGELASLKELVGLNSLYTDYDLIPAMVKSRSLEAWDKTITINIGSADGVAINDGVLSAQGVVGRVIHVDEKQAVVSLLTANDDNSNVALRIHVDDKTSVLGVLDDFDTSTNLFRIKLLDNSASIIAGMKVATSGLGGIYPPGFYLGEVYEVRNVADGMGVAVYMKSAVDFDDLIYVAVVKKP